jgi:hypothetical protein
MSRVVKKKQRSPVHSKTAYPWPSHKPFRSLIDFCIMGKSHPDLKTSSCDDHIARACHILHDDIDPFLWHRKADREGIAFNKILRNLEKRIAQHNDLRAAEIIYAIATEAAFEVVNLYLRRRDLFDRIAPRRNMLPSLFSIHPETAKVVEQMRADSQLGTLTYHARQVGSKAYFVSDTPANIYARAIITSVEINSNLESIECQQAGWAEFDLKEGVRTRVLPFPRYVEGLDRLPIPITPESVGQYWRKGKAMILEEMPDFHLEPEWKDYHRRHYKDGAKPGAVQHAIFKDILGALKTIAGANRAGSKKASPKA